MENKYSDFNIFTSREQREGFMERISSISLALKKRKASMKLTEAMTPTKHPRSTWLGIYQNVLFCQVLICNK